MKPDTAGSVVCCVCCYLPFVVLPCVGSAESYGPQVLRGESSVSLRSQLALHTAMLKSHYQEYPPQFSQERFLSDALFFHTLKYC